MSISRSFLQSIHKVLDVEFSLLFESMRAGPSARVGPKVHRTKNINKSGGLLGNGPPGHDLVLP